jgi:predicted enzyme related to lactoylglutathione lyase
MTPRNGLQGVGWFSRRCPDPLPTVAFYRDVMGLPLLRGKADSGMFWAGETSTFWVNPGGETPPVYTDRSQSQCTPVFRVHGLPRVMARLESGGARFINDIQMQEGRIAYFLDPSGNVTGIQERLRTSSRAEDQEAFRRWEAGETRIEGIPQLPEDIQSLGWVMVRCQDVQAQVAFYRDVLGMHPGGRLGIMLGPGETQLFEFMADGEPQPVPADRKAVSNAPIIRVAALDPVAAALDAAGVRWVNPPFSNDATGRLAYFVDPENRLVGLQERTPVSERPEDLEAARRRAAAAAGT